MIAHKLAILPLLVATYMFFICEKYGTILTIKFYSKAKIRQPQSYIALRNLQNPYLEIQKNMPQPYGQEGKKNVHVHKDFKVKNIPYVNRTFSTTSTPSKTPK